jgi:hypothetical protein
MRSKPRMSVSMGEIIFTAGFPKIDDDFARMKGHRSDVFYRDHAGGCYELTFLTLERLSFEVKGTLGRENNFYADCGLVVIDEPTKDSIVKAVRELAKRRYFDGLKPVQLEPEPQWSIFPL